MKRLDELYVLRTYVAEEIARHEALIASPARPVNSAGALAKAAALYDVPLELVLTDSREQRATRARQAACWLLRAQGLSLPTIGRIVKRDHTTVMYACAKIDADPAIRALLWPLIEQVA